MAQLSTICNLANNLPRSQRVAIISLIDSKTEGDMQKVLDKLDLMEQKFDAKFDAMEQKFDAKFDAFNAKLNAMDQKFDAKFDALNSRINTTQWFIGGLIALTTIISRIA